MTNRHRQKYITRLLVGLGLITGGILVILYTSFLESKEDRQQAWFMWAGAAIVLINGGLLLLGSAFVHKVKSDLIRKQKLKEQHKKYEFE